MKNNMIKADAIFKENIKKILNEGCWDENPRPRYQSDGTPAYSKFMTQVYEEYDLSKGELPLMTLRPTPIKSCIGEICWIFIQQTSNLDILNNKYNVSYWNPWSIDGGKSIGTRYGATVNKYNLIDKLLDGLKTNPFGRRHLMSLWQESDFEETEGLLPCAFQTLWSVRKVKDNYYLDLTLTQRSSDYITAGAINLLQYVALQMMVAHECNFKLGKFVRFTQNLHIYDRQIEQAKELLNREPLDIQPKLILHADNKSFFDIEVDDFELIDYHPIKPQLKFDLAI